LEHCEYLQLDATFAAVRPDVLCVPLAITANESFPLGFVMAPTERSELDEILANFVPDPGIPRYKDMPVLSDEGSVLQKYVRQHPRHFLCDRDILEGFGSASYVARIVDPLFLSPTKQHCCSCAAHAH
jgi:hypothetical protein